MTAATATLAELIYTATEQWLPVPGYEGLYEASTHGRVRSLDRRVVTKRRKKDGTLEVRNYTGKLMPGSPKESGHLKLALCRDGVEWHTSIHQVAALTFIGPVPEGMETCHNDGDPANNRPENLRYGTKKENSADRVLHGTDDRGMKNVQAKLTDQQVLSIRYTYRRGGVTHRELGREYGVHNTGIGRIVRGEKWTHLPLSPTLADLD